MWSYKFASIHEIRHRKYPVSETPHCSSRNDTSENFRLWCLRVTFFFFSSRRRHTRFDCDWSSDVCSSDLGEISPADPLQAVYPEIKQYALGIGQRLQELGYRGIFGLDCLVDPSGRVYVLEINPRLTGLTPLLTMLYRENQDIPFYLLHILELAGL